MLGSVLLPGTALLELALYAGSRVDLSVLSELVLEAPLILPEQGAVQLQVSVGELDGSGMRSLSIHSHPQEASSGKCCLRSDGRVTPWCARFARGR